MERYVIKREDRPGQMLKGLGIGSRNQIRPDEWTKVTRFAIQFEKEEAEATIEFISNVIDWELGEQLYIEEVKEEGREERCEF